MEDKLLTVEEVAEKLGISKQTVYRYVHEGFMPCLRPGSALRFDWKEIRDWAQKRGQEGRIRRNGVNQFI